MVKKYAQFESDLTRAVNNFSGDSLPMYLPSWMLNNGIVPGSEIESATDIGPLSSKNKTDILVKLRNSEPLKISVKMQNADYMGNWYTHSRIIEEFGQKVFDKITTAVTHWSNEYSHDFDWENKPFVGVSVSFGKRSGKTCIPLKDILSESECNRIVTAMGAGIGSGFGVANALYYSDDIPTNISQLINSLEEMNYDNITKFTGDFKLILRPINPMTEGSNRGKNVFSQFVPYNSLETKTKITTMSELNKLGTFEKVEPNQLNHNRVLNRLELANIIIPRKK